MSAPSTVELPEIPKKLYFTIGEAAALCGVKTHVLRFWEEEFRDLRPVKRCGNRRYYRQQEIVTIRRIRRLLHDEGYTIKGARAQLKALASTRISAPPSVDRASIREMRRELEAVMSLLDSSGSNSHSSTL